MYKYTKIYSNAEPNFEEGDVFRLIVPMRPAVATLTNDRKSNEVTKVTEKVTDVTEVEEMGSIIFWRLDISKNSGFLNIEEKFTNTIDNTSLEGDYALIL